MANIYRILVFHGQKRVCKKIHTQCTRNVCNSKKSNKWWITFHNRFIKCNIERDIHQIEPAQTQKKLNAMMLIFVKHREVYVSERMMFVCLGKQKIWHIPMTSKCCNRTRKRNVWCYTNYVMTWLRVYLKLSIAFATQTTMIILFVYSKPCVCAWYGNTKKAINNSTTHFSILPRPRIFVFAISTLVHDHPKFECIPLCSQWCSLSSTFQLGNMRAQCCCYDACSPFSHHSASRCTANFSFSFSFSFLLNFFSGWIWIADFISIKERKRGER